MRNPGIVILTAALLVMPPVHAGEDEESMKGTAGLGIGAVVGGLLGGPIGAVAGGAWLGAREGERDARRVHLTRELAEREARADAGDLEAYVFDRQVTLELSLADPV